MQSAGRLNSSIKIDLNSYGINFYDNYVGVYDSTPTDITSNETFSAFCRLQPKPTRL